MGDFPVDLKSGHSIHVASPESNLATLVSVQTPSSGGLFSGRVCSYPFRLDRPVRVRKMWLYNGATVSGNIDLGVYDYALKKKVSTGSTAQAGINAIQLIDVTDTDLVPGHYYMSLVMDNGTGTAFKYVSIDIPLLRLAGCIQEATALPLPATLTPAAFTSSIAIVFGMQVGRMA